MNNRKRSLLRIPSLPDIFLFPLNDYLCLTIHLIHMSETRSVAKQKKRPRLKFIDIARSIAILLMLEGHFIDDSLQIKGVVNGVAVDNMYSGEPVYMTWAYIRGFTSPIFLTLTGLVFVYLLLMSRHEKYTRNERVKKGFKRALELLFWGYLLQPNAFHVLQCIGIGIAMILLIFGCYKMVKRLPVFLRKFTPRLPSVTYLWMARIPLWIYYLIAGMATFYIGMELKNNVPDGVGWPYNAPRFIQNMFHGPPDRSLFPIVPNMGYTMIGAMIGCWLHDSQKYVKTWGFAFAFIAIGALGFFLADPILITVDKIIAFLFDLDPATKYFKNVTMNWIMYKVGMVFMVLGVLMIIEKLLGDIKQNLFLKMGQNTLSIYIMHMVVLYGAITGFGLNRLFHDHSSQDGMLLPWEAVLGAILFIGFHMTFVYYIDPLRAFYQKLLATILPWKRIKPKA